MYIFCFFVPETHLEIVKKAVFEAGAGKVGHYTQCAWQTCGEGQFMPLSGSHAFVGEVNQLEKIREYKVEMVCSKEKMKAVVRALKQAHPYEEPAYQVFKNINRP
ncbi:MAG: NGG1p interacting factor NIF3 [Gammaproteobacteria bacterium]|nr:NGG1p interacting factor NIF3 [Gammaproteobacteria bacterium]